MLKKSRKHTYVFKRNASLKKEVYKQFKATNNGIYKEIRKDKSPWWTPSPHNLLIFSIGVIIFGLISHIHELDILPICIANYINLHLVIKQNDYMIAICIGIGAVLIGLAFFVAQSFLDKEDPDRGRVLLYTSKFYVLLTGDIAILLMYVFWKPNILADILIVVLSVFTILSLYRTVKVLIYVNDMEKERIVLIKGIIRPFILHEVCRRISYHMLFKANEILQNKYKGISINPFMQDSGFFTFRSIEEGTIVDIKLGAYERLFILLSKKLSQMKLINAQIKSDDFPEKDRITKDDDEKKIILCLKVLPYSIVKENTVLFGINKGIIKYNPSIKNKSWNNNIKRLFIIKKIDIEEKAKLEISKAQQKCITLIMQDKPDAFLDSLQIYKESINEFFNILRNIDWKFDKEQAAKQRGAFSGERFKLLDWIIDSYTLIFYKAMNSDSLQIIKNASYFPISLSELAIRRNDHFIFQNFIRYPVLMYIKGYKRKQTNKDAYDFIIDRSWRYLKELSGFFLEHPYEERRIEEQDFLDYSFYILKVFQDLLKQSYDNRDIETFKIYLSKYTSLYEYLNYNTRYKSTGQSTFDKVNVSRNETLFGTGSWIFNRHLDNNEAINLTYLNEIFEVLELDIIELTELFIDVHEDSNRWGWEDWEIETKEEGKTHSLNTPNELEKFYVVICLRLLQSSPSIDSIHVPFSSELALLTDALIQIVKSIRDDPEKWDVLGNQILKCDDLIRLLEIAKKQQKEKEAEFIRETPISIDKVNAFKEGVLKSMGTVQGIKSLMQHYRAVILEKERSTLSDKFGINRFFEKEWFIDGEELNATWVGIDEHIGESMINGENQSILQKLQEEAQEIPEESFEERLDKIDNLDKVSIITVNYQPFDFFESIHGSFRYIANWYADFSDKWMKEFPEGLEGVLIYRQKRIPVYEYFNNLSFKGVLIVNFKNLKLSQYPLDLESDQPYITIDVKGFEWGSIEEDEIIKNAPEWLKKIGDQEAQRYYIEERVIVKVFEQFDLIIDKNAVARIPLE